MFVEIKLTGKARREGKGVRLYLTMGAFHSTKTSENFEKGTNGDGISESFIDCKQSLFSSKIRGEEGKTSNPMCATSEPLVARASDRQSHVTLTVTLARLLVLSLSCVLPYDFRGKERLLAA